jgi:hypothetical protein
VGISSEFSFLVAGTHDPLRRRVGATSDDVGAVQRCILFHVLLRPIAIFAIDTKLIWGKMPRLQQQFTDTLNAKRER